ncbi:hypothetical protein [Faecalibacillus faecis]|uniref:hypothetical protein n=1 Tax=Faecalibacillus faecis TaxID=1982628 RepID=UPI003867B3E7
MEIKKKYELTDEIKNIRGKTLHRIRALRNFSNIKAGDLGGFIESEKNLSHDGICWIYDNAMAMDSAQILENAFIYNKAKIMDNAKVSEHAIIRDSATISNHAHVLGEADIRDTAEIFDYALVYDRALICGNAYLGDTTQVFGSATISGSATINDCAIICGWAEISDDAVIQDNACISGTAEVGGKAVIGGTVNLKHGTINKGTFLSQKKIDIYLLVNSESSTNLNVLLNNIKFKEI